MTPKTLRILLYANIGLLAFCVIAQIINCNLFSAACNFVWIICCIVFAGCIHKTEGIFHTNNILITFMAKITKHTDQGETVAIKQEADGKLHIYPAKEVGVDPAQEGGNK